jgi:hypothetical protein
LSAPEGGHAGETPGASGGAGAGGQGGSADDALVAFYPFSGDSLDASGNGNDCAAGTATLEADRHGTPNSAYHFAGTSSSYMTCGSSASLGVTGALTLAAWFKPEAASLTGLNRALIAKWMPPDQRSYALLIQVEDQTGVGLCSATTGISFVVDPLGTGSVPEGTLCDDMPVQVDVWQHAAAVFEPGQRLSIYLNGVLVSEQTEAQVVTGASNSTTPLLLGRNNLGYYTGSLDEARVYARALGPPEIAALAAL